jgi:uncharacterized protein YcbK (DUF882 family)
MSTKPQRCRAPWPALLAGALSIATLSASVNAEPGEDPEPQYANLPSGSRMAPAMTASLPDSGQRSLKGLSMFSNSVALGRIALRDSTPTNCLPGQLREVLADVATKFGTVSIQSTHRSQGHNWSAGGARHSLHLSCRAVDFRIRTRTAGVMTFLRSRPEVGGLKIYPNGIIHIDNGERRTW